jgi:PIN domain nuclease of toxin-antitoxin system
VSAASGWEIATKSRLGKLPGAEGLLQDLPSLMQHQGFQPLVSLDPALATFPCRLLW